MLPLAVLLATACGCSTSSKPPVIRTEIVRPVLPASAKVACTDPVRLPDRALGQGETTTYWGRDRAALRQCEVRRAAAVKAFESETQ